MMNLRNASECLSLAVSNLDEGIRCVKWLSNELYDQELGLDCWRENINIFIKWLKRKPYRYSIDLGKYIMISALFSRYIEIFALRPKNANRLALREIDRWT